MYILPSFYNVQPSSSSPILFSGQNSINSILRAKITRSPLTNSILRAKLTLSILFYSKSQDHPLPIIFSGPNSPYQFYSKGKNHMTTPYQFYSQGQTHPFNSIVRTKITRSPQTNSILRTKLYQFYSKDQNHKPIPYQLYSQGEAELWQEISVLRPQISHLASKPWWVLLLFIPEKNSFNQELLHHDHRHHLPHPHHHNHDHHDHHDHHQFSWVNKWSAGRRSATQWRL